jgi:hypothetical protein
MAEIFTFPASRPSAGRQLRSLPPPTKGRFGGLAHTPGADRTCILPGFGA